MHLKKFNNFPQAMRMDGDTLAGINDGQSVDELVGGQVGLTYKYPYTLSSFL